MLLFFLHKRLLTFEMCHTDYIPSVRLCLTIIHLYFHYIFHCIILIYSASYWRNIWIDRKVWFSNCTFLQQYLHMITTITLCMYVHHCSTYFRLWYIKRAPQVHLLLPYLVTLCIFTAHKIPAAVVSIAFHVFKSRRGDTSGLLLSEGPLISKLLTGFS